MDPVRARALVKRWARLWALPGLERRVSIEVSTRLTRSLGRTFPARRLVRLHPDATKGRLFERVLCHEVAHVAAWELHGRRAKPHGKSWRMLVERAGFAPETRIGPALPRARSPLRFEHRCPVCHAVRFGKRPVRRWRCAACVAAGLDGRMMIRKRAA